MEWVFVIVGGGASSVGLVGLMAAFCGVAGKADRRNDALRQRELLGLSLTEPTPELRQSVRRERAA